MCTYTDVLYSCGCCGPPVCDTTCSQIMSELDRINHPEAWEGEGLNQLPFDMADECMPNWHNATLVRELTECDDYLLGGVCLPERRVPVWLASIVPWPQLSLEGLEDNVERPEDNVAWLGFDVAGLEDNAESAGYNFAPLEFFPTVPDYYQPALPAYGSVSPEYDPAGQEYDSTWPPYDPTYGI